MADAHPDGGGTAEQFIQARCRHYTALRPARTAPPPTSPVRVSSGTREQGPRKDTVHDAAPIDFHRHVIPNVYLEAMDQAAVRDPIHGVTVEPRWGCWD